MSIPQTPSLTRSPSAWGGKYNSGSLSHCNINNRLSLASARKISTSVILAVLVTREILSTGTPYESNGAALAIDSILRVFGGTRHSHW